MSALDEAHWNRRDAAQILAIPYSTLRCKMQKLGITKLRGQVAASIRVPRIARITRLPKNHSPLIESPNGLPVRETFGQPFRRGRENCAEHDFVFSYAHFGPPRKTQKGTKNHVLCLFVFLVAIPRLPRQIAQPQVSNVY